MRSLCTYLKVEYVHGRGWSPAAVNEWAGRGRGDHPCDQGSHSQLQPSYTGQHAQQVHDEALGMRKGCALSCTVAMSVRNSMLARLKLLHTSIVAISGISPDLPSRPSPERTPWILPATRSRRTWAVPVSKKRNMRRDSLTYKNDQKMER